MTYPALEGGRGMTPEQVENLTIGQIESLLKSPKDIRWEESEGRRAKEWVQRRKSQWATPEQAKEARARARAKRRAGG